jgi:hypothetical protein
MTSPPLARHAKREPRRGRGLADRADVAGAPTVAMGDTVIWAENDSNDRKISM